MASKITINVFIVLFTVLLTSDTAINNVNENKSRYAKDHLIVKLKNNVSQVSAAGISSPISLLSTFRFLIPDFKITRVKPLFPLDLHQNTELALKYEMDRFYVVYIDPEKDVLQICREFETNELIEFAEPDFIGESAGLRNLVSSTKPNDEFFNRQWGLYNDGSVRTTTGRSGKAGADMNVIKGWEIETGSDSVIVAILDSGTKLDHPDLDGRIWINKNERKNGRDDDGNGFVDDINGYNFAYENSNVRDDGGHGTNICGTIGASTNNRIGYAGIDQHCKLMVCKNLDDENLGEYSWWSASLYYAANNGAKIINMSEGGYDYSKTLNTAVDFAYESGCLIVASMMNKNNDDNYYPASFNNVLAIGATDTDDSRCRQFTWGGGSNWGSHISVVAPGNRIYGLDYSDNDNYDVYWSGTSQATAYVSGLAALLLSQNSARTNKELREIIISTGVDRIGDPREDSPGWDKYYGYGRIDMYAALTYGKTPVENIENKEIKKGSNLEERKSEESKQAKAVERNSSDRKESNEGRNARKVEY